MKALILSAIRCSLMFTAITVSLFSVRPAQAFTVTLEQVGANVVATGSGAINLSGLTFSFATEAISPAIHANDGFISLGAAGEEARAQIDIYTGFTGPATFGSGGEFDTNLGSGSFVGIGRPFGIIVPLFYQSGAPLSGNATWNNATFASLGVTPGTYVWTWGTGANQNFTLKIPSLPDSSSSFGLFALGLIGLFSVGRFRSRQYA